MVKLVVATTVDPASVGLASAFLAMPGWHPGPPLQVLTEQAEAIVEDARTQGSGSSKSGRVGSPVEAFDNDSANSVDAVGVDSLDATHEVTNLAVDKNCRVHERWEVQEDSHGWRIRFE
ncbi:hypothetical protein QJS10_CPB15g00976 [Acorus calamus]|uniref:Uncharacterized protein n=1 Tax=Acorus calamus TaxID=4465 RepID=A0AAV9D536_ACOCL|nr:hypothetical protein QJS10_CPB15g00976 [Acorus calamus]